MHPKAGQSPDPRASQRAGFALFCLSLLAYGYFIYRGPHDNPDSRLALTYSLVERGALDIDPYAASMRDRAFWRGHYYTDKAPGLSFWLAPFYAGLRLTVGDRLEVKDQGSTTGPGQVDRFAIRYLLTFLGIGIPAAIFNAALFRWLGRVEPHPMPRFAVCLGYALGSPVYPFATSAFGHVPAGMCLAGAFGLLCTRGQRARPTWLSLAGALLAAAVATEYPAAAPAAIVGAYGVWRAPRVKVAAGWLVAGAIPIMIGLAAYHWAAFGQPWAVGYAHLAPGTDFAAGQAGGLLGVHLPRVQVATALLIGWQRGLLVHAPWLALAVPGAAALWRQRTYQVEGSVALGLFLATLAVNSGYAFWHGGASWGPRHLVPALPFLAPLTLPAAASYPQLCAGLIATSVLLTMAAVATSALAGPEVAVPLRDVLWSNVLAGRVTNNWGHLVGLTGWWSVLPLVAAGVLLVAWAIRPRRRAL